MDLEVPAGSLTAILGLSGSGKTTLLRLLAGFERADTGTIGIGGVLVDGPGAYLPPERHRIGYVPQEGSLFPHLTVAGNVGFGLPAGQRRGGKVDALLETVGLGGFGRRYPHQLSGGQQQRVALARALAIEPAVVLLGALPLDPAAAIPGAAGQVTVLIRPEQIDIAPNEDGLTAHVTSYRYHGHDAVLCAQPEDDAGSRRGPSPLVVRIVGGSHRPVGSAVTLRARGPVFAWPAD